MEGLFAYDVSVMSWTFLSLITRTEEGVGSGEKARKGWQTAYSKVKGRLTTLRCFVDYVMLTTTLNLKMYLHHALRLSGFDVVVQRYVDYTGNKEVIKNGEKIIWQKTATQTA